MSIRKEHPHTIGTAFTEEDVENKTVPVWEQVVKDEQGRRRFHGAFTGGFSAGHFNTVGTPEGWTPSDFTSSRKSRSSKKEQTPEMFMDAEDLNEELGQALKTRDEFKSFGTQQKPKLGKLEELLIPAKDPVGVKLLRLMGWREGQGIGPRRNKKEVKPKSQQPISATRIMGPRIPQEVLQTLNREEELEDEEETTYKSVAAEDVPSVEYIPKSDLYGLGFDPFTAAPEFKKPSAPTSATPKNQQVLRMADALSGKATGAKAFGLGAFEEDEDDEVYSHDAMDAYDRVLGGEEPKPQKQVPDPPKEAASVIDTSRRCTDGSFPLRNFKLASLTTQKPKWFDPPKIPMNYTPKGPYSSETESTESTFEERFQRGNTAMDAKRRGELLGETPLPSSKALQQQHPDRSGKSSVFQFISAEDKARLDSLKNRFSSGGIENMGVTEEKHEIEWQKQKREMEEHQRKVFAETQEKFKPLGAMMSQKFVKESEPGSQPKSEYKTDTYQDTAAQMGMFGRLTRSVQEWYPENLVCRRFGVKNPYAGKKAPEKSGTSDFMGSGWELGPGFSTTENELELRRQQEEVKAHQGPQQEQPAPEFETIETNNNATELDTEEPDVEPEEPPPPRPSMDIFKAIFENDDDDDISLKSAPSSNNNNNNASKPTHAEVLPPKPAESHKPITSSPPPQPSITGPALPPPTTESGENPYLYVPPKQDSRGGRQMLAPVPPPEVKAAIEKEREREEKSEKKEKKHKKHKDKKDKKHKKHKRSRSKSPSHKDKKHRRD